MTCARLPHHLGCHRHKFFDDTAQLIEGNVFLMMAVRVALTVVRVLGVLRRNPHPNAIWIPKVSDFKMTRFHYYYL